MYAVTLLLSKPAILRKNAPNIRRICNMKGTHLCAANVPGSQFSLNFRPFRVIGHIVTSAPNDPEWPYEYYMVKGSP